jgi:hypothetical protein
MLVAALAVTAANPAIRPSDDVFSANRAGVGEDPISDHLRMLHDVRLGGLIEYACALTLRIILTMSFRGMSSVCMPGQLPQHTW